MTESLGLTKAEEKILRKAVYSDLKERNKVLIALVILFVVPNILYDLDKYFGVIGGGIIQIHDRLAEFWSASNFIIFFIILFYSRGTLVFSTIRKLHSNLSSEQRLHANLNNAGLCS